MKSRIWGHIGSLITIIILVLVKELNEEMTNRSWDPQTEAKKVLDPYLEKILGKARPKKSDGK